MHGRLTWQLAREGPAILPTDKRNKNGFTAFQFWFYREFNLLNNEAKQLYVSGWYQLVPTTQPILEIPDDIDEDNRWWYCVVGIL